jgi:hypothetical protein
MTTKKQQPTYEDDYYATEKKRIAEEAQKAHKIHEVEIQSHLTAMIPYYDDAEGEDRRRLLLLNNLLINRFEEPGMMYWNIFRNAPREIADYADLFGSDLSKSDQEGIIVYLEQKKEEAKNMVDIGFDEDGEEDEVVFGGEKDDEPEEIEEKEAD